MSLPLNSRSDNHLSKLKTDEISFDFKQIITVTLKNWYLFIAGVFFCLIIAIIYGYYTPRDWSVSSKILVEDSKNSPSSVLGNSSGLGADFSSVFNVKSSADNELQILKSRSLMSNTVNSLHLNVRTYLIDGLKSTEIYQESPFEVKLNYKADTLIFQKYIVKIQKNGDFLLSNSKENINLSGRFGKNIRLPQYNLTLNAVPGGKLSGEYAITIQSIDATILELTKQFNVSLSDKQSTTIDLGLNYPNSKKGEVILEELMKLYLLSNIEYKVQNADNTIKFIDGRIGLVFDELNNVESKFEKYKQQENIADISTQSKVLVTSQSEYYDKLNQIETQLGVFNQLLKVLTNPNNKSSIPSGMVAPTDVSFGQSINSFNQLLIERDRASLGYTSDNPVMENYDMQIETARKTLVRTAEDYVHNLNTSKSELLKQNGSLNFKLQQIPSKDRGYLDLQRQQTLKQELYLFLLQKREETAISKTSTISSARIIDHAKSDFYPYKPKRSIIYLFGALTGLIIPSLFLIIKEWLNVKVRSIQDIEKVTSISVIGEIGHNMNDESLVTTNNSRTVVSEQFRSLRTKLMYLLPSKKSNVILFTSSMSGEGKSFITLNLGSALALTGKKVVFLELDLRKPKLSEIMGHDNKTYGYSNYVVSEYADLNKLIKATWFNENCSLISSGPIPPNPAELLGNEKLSTLLDQLKLRFEYIIIDCAPVGLVTDALLIEKYADLTFYVVREGYTFKSQLDILNDLKFKDKVENLYILLNDIKTEKEGYSSYGYGIETNKNPKFKLF